MFIRLGLKPEAQTNMIQGALEMIAMQSYNRFERLRVQKIRLTLIDTGCVWELMGYKYKNFTLAI